MPKLTVLPANASAEVPPGNTLIQAGERAGVEMEGGCFACFCGTCLVEIISGLDNLSQPTPEELDVLDGWNKDSTRYRLACCTRIQKGEVTIQQKH